MLVLAFPKNISATLRSEPETFLGIGTAWYGKFNNLAARRVASGSGGGRGVGVRRKKEGAIYSMPSSVRFHALGSGPGLKQSAPQERACGRRESHHFQ